MEIRKFIYSNCKDSVDSSNKAAIFEIQVFIIIREHSDHMFYFLAADSLNNELTISRKEEETSACSSSKSRFLNRFNIFVRLQ